MDALYSRYNDLLAEGDISGAVETLEMAYKYMSVEYRLMRTRIKTLAGSV